MEKRKMFFLSVIGLFTLLQTACSHPHANDSLHDRVERIQNDYNYSATCDKEEVYPIELQDVEIPSYVEFPEVVDKKNLPSMRKKLKMESFEILRAHKLELSKRSQAARSEYIKNNEISLCELDCNMQLKQSLDKAFVKSHVWHQDNLIRIEHWYRQSQIELDDWYSESR